MHSLSLLRLRRTAGACCLAGFGLPASAQLSAPANPPAVPQVAVKGASALAVRRDDPLGRVTVGREELARFGDTSLAGALQRVAGVSVSNGEIRLRGLGAGYTQILIDGEPAPGGFAVDSLSPDLVERIEIQRSSQADASAQAMAGSINIVMRKASGPARRTVKLGAERGWLATSRSMALQWTGRDGSAGYGLGLTLQDDRRRERSSIDARTGAIGLHHVDEDSDARLRKLSVAPRIDVDFAGGDKLGWQALVDLASSDGSVRQLETTLQGSPTASPDARWRAVYDTWLIKSDLTWSHRTQAGRLVLKAGVEANGRDGDYLFRGVDAAGTPWLHRAVRSGAFERRASSSGKYLAPIAAGHEMAVGWDGAVTRRSESRQQSDTDPLQPDAAAFHALDQRYAATVGRLGLYAQDEWALSDRLQAYLGLRWESLDTRTRGGGLADAATASRVWSPIAQMVWKLPASTRNQLRLALARTYKAPQPRNLVPRRFTVSNDNSPATPDYQGNPLLRPELAWGLDGALESYFAGEGMVSVSAYVRRIQNVTLLALRQESGVWVSMPVNGAGASVHGIEFDARLPVPGTPAVTVRANLARNWSRVDDLAGPANRLASQAPLTANIGGDARLAHGASVGANFRVVGGWDARTAQALVETTGIVRDLEAYAAWQATHGTWRLTLSDLLHRARAGGQAYDDGVVTTTRMVATPRPARVRLQFEAPI